METKEKGLEGKLTFGDHASIAFDCGSFDCGFKDSLASQCYVYGSVLKTLEMIGVPMVLAIDAVRGTMGLDTVQAVATMTLGYGIGCAMKMYGEKYYEKKVDISPQ